MKSLQKDGRQAIRKAHLAFISGELIKNLWFNLLFLWRCICRKIVDLNIWILQHWNCKTHTWKQEALGSHCLYEQQFFSSQRNNNLIDCCFSPSWEPYGDFRTLNLELCLKYAEAYGSLFLLIMTQDHSILNVPSERPMIFWHFFYICWVHAKWTYQCLWFDAGLRISSRTTKSISTKLGTKWP